MKINSIAQPSVTPFSIDNTKSKSDFGTFLKESIHKLNDLEAASQNMDELLATGEIENIHEVMIAAQKAEIAVQFTVEVKNKVLDAYREIMRLQL